MQFTFFKCSKFTFSKMGLLLLFGGTGLLFGKDERPPVSTDRPSVSASTQTAPWLAGLVESGFQWQIFEPGNGPIDLRFRQFSTPLLLRYGLFENLEFRVETSGFNWNDLRIREPGQPAVSSSDSGLANPSLGLKWRFVDTPENSYQPAVALLLNWGLPVGSEGFHSEKSSFGALLLVDFPLPNSLSLTLNGGLYSRWDDATRDCFKEGLGALSLSAPLAAKTGMFIEVAGGGPQADGGEGYALIDGGITHLLSDSLQLDFAVTRGLTSQTTDWGFAGGLSFYLF